MGKFKLFCESPYDEREIELEYFDDETQDGLRNVEIYVDPSSVEIARVCRDRHGMGGCRIGMANLNKVYIWSDTVLHADVERYFDLDFGVYKFIYPEMSSTDLRISTINNKKEFDKDIDKKAIQRLLLFFPDTKRIVDEDHGRLVYEVK